MGCVGVKVIKGVVEFFMFVEEVRGEVMIKRREFGVGGLVY